VRPGFCFPQNAAEMRSLEDQRHNRLFRSEMKATLYEALGIQRAPPMKRWRAALRRLIRKYYAKTRRWPGKRREAHAFHHHASRILGDGARRQRYDEELALSAGQRSKNRACCLQRDRRRPASKRTCTARRKPRYASMIFSIRNPGEDS